MPQRATWTPPFPDSAGAWLRPVPYAMKPLFASRNGNLYRERDTRRIGDKVILWSRRPPLRPRMAKHGTDRFLRVEVRLTIDPPERRCAHAVKTLVARAWFLELLTGTDWRIVNANGDPFDCRVDNLSIERGRPKETLHLWEWERLALRLFRLGRSLSSVQLATGLPLESLIQIRDSVKEDKARELEEYAGATFGSVYDAD